MLELGDLDVLGTKFSEAGEATGRAVSEVPGAGTEKPEPQEHPMSHFRGLGLS